MYHVPVSFSKVSLLVLHRIQNDVTGLAFRRSIEISSPQSSQIPYSPFSISSKDFLIFLINMLSLSRIRSFVLLLDSKEALSSGSARCSSGSNKCSTVSSACSNSSCSHCDRCFLKNYRSFSTMIIIPIIRCLKKLGYTID